MDGKKERKTYDRQFKVDAVNLVVQGGVRVQEVARNLGIDPNRLSHWKRELEEDGSVAFPGKGKLTPEAEEIRRLRRELEQAQQERDILKKALAYFSRNAK
jgi:transposase